MAIATEKTTGEKLEGIAFQFCKIATVSFIAGRFTLPIASSLAAILYLAAHLKGKHDTRCVLRYPLLIAAFWGLISVGAWALVLNPELPGKLLRLIGFGS